MASGFALTGVRTQFRKILIVTPIIGAIGMTAASLLGYPIAGALFCVGLALGLINTRMVIGAAVRYAATEDPSKGPVISGSLQRLAVITVVGFGLAYAFRPEGLAVLIGLAFYQVLMMGSASGPLLREVRKG